MYQDTFNIFADQSFDDFAASFMGGLGSKIRSESKEYLLNVNRTEYLDHSASEYEIAPLVLDFDVSLFRPRRIISRRKDFPTTSMYSQANLIQSRS